MAKPKNVLILIKTLQEASIAENRWSSDANVKALKAAVKNMFEAAAGRSPTPEEMEQIRIWHPDMD